MLSAHKQLLVKPPIKVCFDEVYNLSPCCKWLGWLLALSQAGAENSGSRSTKGTRPRAAGGDGVRAPWGPVRFPELPLYRGDHQAQRWGSSESKPVKTTRTGEHVAEHKREQSSETVPKFSCAKDSLGYPRGWI